MRIYALVFAATMCGCATSGPTYYEGQLWAQKVFDQASAECYEDIQKDSSSGSYMLCMKARGWFEVRSCRGGYRCESSR